MRLIKSSLKKVLTAIVCFTMLFSIAFSNVALGADFTPIAPPQNAQGQYEISKPEHLMYMSKNYGKKDIPKNGTYILTNDIDMTGIQGFTPMGKDKENGFAGVFDGQNHVIKNLTISMGGKKYVALFGYIGNEDVLAVIKNLGLVNVNVTGTQNVGGLVGVSYGTIINCFVTGKLKDDGGSNAQTVGGIVGKNKEGEGSVVGLIKDCYAIVDIEGSYNLGGIAGLEDGGGIIENCYTAGTILAKNANGAVGGIVGGFSAGQRVANNATLVSKITGEANTDKIIGQLEDESGMQIVGNIAWDAMQIIGNEPSEQPIKWTDKTSKELTSKETYIKLGWDFDKVWDWKGLNDNGYPVLRGFSKDIQDYKFDLKSNLTINHTPVKEVKANTDITILAKVISGSEISKVEVFYGDDANGSSFTKSITLINESENIFTGKIPGKATGKLYYYIKATSKEGVITKPYNINNSIGIAIDDGTVFGEPKEIVMSLGEKQSSMSFNWTTIPQVKDTVIQYAKKDCFDGKYSEVIGTSYIIAVTQGFKEKMSHKVTINNLEPNTTYVYRVGDGKSFISKQYEFKSPPASGASEEFTFIFTSDPQSVSEKDYETLKFVYDYAITQNPNAAFTLMAGDITQDGYKASQWAAFFNVMGERFTKMPFMPALGNHDFKADSKYLTFKSRFNTPANGPGGDLGNTVYAWEYGDAFFATLNTEAVPTAAIEPSLDKQLDWLENQISKTTKKWKIVQLHEGAYSSNHDPAAIRSITADRLEKMKVDLVLSGHDHLYLRTTMKGDEKVGLGESTTYVTGGTVGNKFYQVVPERSNRWTEVYADKVDLQIVNFVTVSKDKITLKAMQRVDPKSKEFIEIDKFELTNTVAEGRKPTIQKVYIVLPGDCLWSIGLKFGTTWQKLAEINNISNPNLIYIDQVLVLP